MVALPEKGSLKATDSTLVVEDANSVTFILTTATSYVNYRDISGDPAARCEKILADVRGKNFKTLKNTHLDDFTTLMSRVSLKIGDPVKNEMPTDARVAALKKGESDPDLLAKIFQLAVYDVSAAETAVNH